MLNKRQAPGRDFHKHFSLAPARSDTNSPSNPQSAPAPNPLTRTSSQGPALHFNYYKTGLKLAKRRREHHTCHSSLSLPPPHPACALPPPPHSPPRCPPSTSTKCRLKRHVTSTKCRLKRHIHRRERESMHRRRMQGGPYINHVAACPPSLRI